MKIKILFSLFITLIGLSSSRLLYAQSAKYQWSQKTSGGYTYKFVSNDPMKARFYTLQNGLTVILTENKKEPRIAVRISVRAGSNTDPKDHTGLAHYLEHLLFKGTTHYGTTNYEKEKPYLDEIESLYEVYNKTKDSDKRKTLYHKIDSISGLAAQLSIANEYNKMMSDLGSIGTNAHTWLEETVYKENIPSSSLDKFLQIQAERFRNPVFRNFHTELEAVYEEKNRALDEDEWKLNDAIHMNLFPTSNYGQQTTIGTIDHLQNPSLKAIKAYYDQYYVPNNMAIILSGDFNPDATIKLIDRYFAYMKPKPVADYSYTPEPEIKGPVITDIFGPSNERVYIGFRIGPHDSKEALMADLIGSILSNGKAGLIDLNLLKQQKVLSAGAFVERQYKDYGIFRLFAKPKTNQSLEEVKDLLLNQIELIKKGEFEASLVNAIIANNKFHEISNMSDNLERVAQLSASFIASKGAGWNKNVSYLERLSTVTKQDIIAFAKEFFRADNYTVLYKRQGEDKNIIKVEKPPITPIESNEHLQSDYLVKMSNMPSMPVKPVWIDFQKSIRQAKVGPAELLYIPNKDNERFSLTYHFDMGFYNDRSLSTALKYLSVLGTGKYTAEQLSKSLYNIACDYKINLSGEQLIIQIQGLQENFDQAVQLVEHIFSNCKPDEDALANLKQILLKSKTDAKLSKENIMYGLTQYAMYGPKNPFNNSSLTNEELAKVKSEDLIKTINNLMKYKHTIMYYGPAELNEINSKIRQAHKLPAAFLPYPVGTSFSRSSQISNLVLFADYDMVQAEVKWVRNTSAYSPDEELVVDVFNNYFGYGSSGMDNIVFQNIRESRALAYSTFAYYISPDKKHDMYSFVAYVGSQADKILEAIDGMNELINNMPKSEKHFESAKANLKSGLETDRITEESILDNYLNARRKGINHDIRKMKYEKLGNITFDDIANFEVKQLAGKAYTYCIMGSEKKVALDTLKKYGEVKKLSLEEIFGY